MAIEVTKRPFNISFSGNPVHYQLKSDQAQTNPDIRFEIRLQFQGAGGGAWQVIGPVLPYDHINGIANINVQDLLHAQLQYDMPGFPVDETTIQTMNNQSGLFYLEFREVTTLNPNPSWNTSELDFQRVVIKGGLNFFSWQGNNFFVNYFEPVKPFLTWQINGRLAAPTERMFLTWLNGWVDDTTPLVQRIRVTYSDGTQQVIDRAFPGGGKWVCFLLPVGMSQLGLQAIHPDRTIHFWEISVVDTTGGGTPLSQVFRYYQDNRNDQNETVLYYRGSLGGLDSVRVRGVIEQNIEYQFTEVDRAFSADYFAGNAIQPQRSTTDHLEKQTFRGDIGYLAKEEQDRLRDIHIQRDVHVQKGTKWLPVVLVTKSFKLRTTKDNLWSMPIEWQYAYDGASYYTPNAVDLGNAVFSDNVCLASFININVTPNFLEPDLPADQCVVRVDLTEVDPQNASGILKYRVPGYFDWIEIVTTNTFSFYFPRNVATATIEIVAICNAANPDIPGKVNRFEFDTIDAAIVPPPPPGSNEFICTLYNDSAIGDRVIIRVDGVLIKSLFIGAGSSIQLAEVFAGNPNAEFELIFRDLSPGFVQLNTTGHSYYPTTLDGSTVVISGVNIDSDFEISFS